MHNNLDDELHPLYAAGNPYAGKNSKIERSLRARRQLRDRRGRFIYMGGGLSTIFRKRDGSLVNTIGRSVGASNREGFAQLMVENSAEGIDAGVYDVPAGNSQVAQAILPGSASSVPYTGSATSADIVDFDSIERRDAPLGWTKNDDGSFSSEDGEWSIAQNEDGRWTVAQNDKAIDGDFRDAASAITRATAIDAEDTADEETKKRVATLRERGSDPIAIDRAIFNAPEYEVGEDADQYFYDEASTGTKVQTSFKYGDYEDNVNLIGTRQEDGSWKFERNPNEPWNEDFNKFEDTYTPEEVLDQFESTQIAELPEEKELNQLKRFEKALAKDEMYDPTLAGKIKEAKQKLDDAKAKYEEVETELDSTEDADSQGELLDQLLKLNESIGSLEDEQGALLAKLPESGQEGENTVESISARIKRLEQRAQGRFNRGEDTEDLDKEIADLEQKRQALIDAGEKDGGAEADGGAEGDLPGDLVGEDARGAQLERRGDSLRDVSGNVVATKVDEVANAEEIREGGAKVVDLFEVNPENAEVFRNALIEAAESNPYGKSVTIHDLDYYKQDGVRLFLTQDGKGGIALNGDEIVSGFMGDGAVDRGQGAVQSMIAKMVELGGRRLDAYDTILPKLYAEAGFKPVARIKWDDEFAPEGWDYELYGDYNEGRPDIVFMAYDPARVGSKYDPSEGDYVDDYDKGLPAQKAALQPVTDEVVTKDLTDRQKAAQARRQAAQEANDALKGGDGLLEGEVPSNARGSISNQALQLAPIGQVLEATSRNGRKRRFIKVGKDTWKRTDKPDDKKRYRSFELRGGKADFVARTEADVPSVDETRGPVDRYRPKPFSFPRNASEEELARLREIYQNQADTDENPGGVLRATETVRLIDMAIARRKGEPIARLRPATQRRTEDIRAGRATAPENVAPRRTRRRVTAPLLPENIEGSGDSEEPFTPTNNMPEGTTDDPEVLAEMFDSSDLKKAYLGAIFSGSFSASLQFPGQDGEAGPQANVSINAIRDALQRQGIDTNQLVENFREQLLNSRNDGAEPATQRAPEDDVTRSQFLDGLYQTRHEIEAAISLALQNDRPKEEIDFLIDQRNGFTRAIRRLELMGFRSTEEVEKVDLDNFKWDVDAPDIYNPDLIMEAMRRKYPEAEVLPNGDLLVATNFRTDRNGNRLKYDVIVTKTEDETFYTYIRETNLSMMGAPGSVRSMRVGNMRQSAHALNNQTVEAISKVMMTDRRVKIEVWFNSRNDRERAGQYIQIDELDENGVPTHAKQRVFTYEAIRKIQEAVNDDDITEEMINTLYNYVLNMGNGEDVAATLYESFGLDLNTMNKFIDAVNQNIDNRLDAVNSFSKWQTANGTPIAEGDLVEYVGGPDQPGFEQLNGRRGIVEIRRLEHTVTDRNTGVKYTYTDVVYVRMVDENGVPTRETYRIIPAKHLSIIKTAAGTDGSERRGDAGMTVPPPALTRRATNRYAGRRRLRDVAPYVSQYDRNNLDSPTVTIDGESYPVRLSRASLIPENVEKISATPADLKVGDFIKTYEDIDGYPTSRLNEIVKIEELEDGSRLVHTVMPLDLFSGRTAATQFGPDDAIALEVYREADVPDVEVDINAPGLSSNQVARLAELAHQVDMSQVSPDTRDRVREIVNSTDPASLPYTPRQFADIFRELLEAEQTGLAGAVSPEEANRIAERFLRNGQPTPDAAQGISSVARAGVQRSAQINGNTVTPSQRTVSQTPQSPSQRAFIDGTLERGPYPAEAGQASISPEEMRNAIQSGDLNKLQDVISKIYENRVFGSKFAIEGVTVRRNGDGGITWGGRLVDPETGQKVGDVSRDITIDSRGRLNVYHRYLWIDARANRGTGFSTEFKKLSDDFYKSVGVDYITISTVQDGSYAWGKANYTWKTESDAQLLRRYLVGQRRNLPSFDTENAKILDDMIARFDKDFLDPDFPDPIDIANLTKADGTPWGREIMTDTGWRGIRYLNPEMDPRPQNRKDKGKKEEPVPAETKESKPVDTSREEVVPGEAEADQQSGTEASADTAKYFDADGVLKSEEWIDEAPDGSVLEYTTDFGEVRLYSKKDGQWYNLTYNMADGVPNPEDNISSGYLKVVAGRLGRDGTKLREVSSNPEEFQKYNDFANGTLGEANVDEMAVIEAINNKDGLAIANLFVQELFGNGEKQFGDFYIKHAQVTPSVYATTGEPKMTITASIVNSDGEEVGTIVRVLKQNQNGDIRVVHSLMKIYEDENKGTGFSSQFSAASEDFYKRLNVAEIETLTAWDGSYVWARAQYDWNFEDYSVNMALGGVPDALDDALEQAIMDNRSKDANAISDIIERMSGLDSDDPNFPTPYEISSLTSEDPNIKSLGRDILTDTKWQGLKRLNSSNEGDGQTSEEESTSAPTPTEETPTTTETQAGPVRVADFTTGPSEEFEGWDGVDGLAFRQARIDAARASGMSLIDAQNFSEEDRQKAIEHLNNLLPTTVQDDNAKYFAKGNHVVRVPNGELDSPYTYAVLGSLNDIIDKFPPGNVDTDYIINVVDSVNADMPGAGGRFVPGMGMIDYFMPKVESSWLESQPGMKGWFSPAIDELLDENAPEDTIRQYIAHIVAHEYGHLLDNSFSDELRTKFRAELDKAGLTDIVGRYANSYADENTRGAGNIRNAEYFAESFAQMINEDFHGATNTPLGNLMRQFLKDNGVTK